MTGVNIDITARKAAEEALRELAEARGMERFRLSFEEAPVGMALIRGDGVWLRVNRALCEMTGYTESELISRDGEITNPDERAEESRLLSRILSGELAAGCAPGAAVGPEPESHSKFWRNNYQLGRSYQLRV